MPGIDLRVLVPERWKEEGKWFSPETPENPSFTYQPAKVACPWLGAAQNYLHSYPQLVDILQSFRPDVIDIWEEPWSLVSAHTCFLRNTLLPQTKIISETEQNINKHLPFPFEQMRTYTLKNADFVVGRSQEALAVVQAKGYYGPSAVVPNGVDVQLFHPTDREIARRNLNLTGFVAGYIGRLVEEKGLMDIVDALEHCPPDVMVLFMGDGPFKANLEMQVQKAGRASQVVFLPGRRLDELPEVMSSLDVFVLPSRTTKRWKEQFGRVIIEAQACQIPVIGSDSGAIPSVIGPGGIVVPEGNPVALAKAITDLSINPALPAELGLSGRRQVEALYSWECVADCMWNIYAQVKPQKFGPYVVSKFALDRADNPLTV
jgi:glycosyltransferase involved in cell wall biosynthesis